MKSKKHLHELIPLYVYDELSEDQKKEVEVHLSYCESCRAFLEETQRMHQVLDKKVTPEPSEALLSKVRFELRDQLRQEKRGGWASPWDAVKEFFTTHSPVPQLAGALTFLVIGFVMGRAFMPQQEQPAVREIANFSTPEEPTHTLISNVDLIQYDSKTGDVTLRYKTVNDISVHGKADDAEISKILAYAVRSEEHPGRRLTAVKAMGSGGVSDTNIEDALIYALENDTVDGVRLRAAKVLRNFPAGENVKHAFIRVLMKEPNSAIRIEALEALAQIKNQDEVAPAFRDASRQDENEFVRMKASRALERLANPEIKNNDTALENSQGIE